LSVSTAPATTTSASPPVRSTSVTPSQTPPAVACDCTGSCALTALSAPAYTDSAEQSDEK
ncbi:hypothetical protein M9458_009216, partial [Cirrhinus mrigala]